MIYKKINKRIIFPLYMWKNHNRMLWRLADIEKTQWLSKQEIDRIQLERLKKLLVYSYNNVEFYRKRFDSAGFNPVKFNDISALKDIPCLTKEDMQNHLNELVAKCVDVKQLIPDSSGGSTGKPTNFFKDLRRHQERRADQIRHDRWCGWDIGEKMVTLWGAQREFEKQPTLKERLVERYIYRSFGFNAFDISEEKVLHYIEQIKKIRPSMIIAYANVAYLFAKIIEEHKVDMGMLGLKGLISSAETLTEEKRDIIEAAFKCKVLNRYGSREVGLIASECLKQKGMHVNSENVVIEIMKDDNEVEPGQTGEVVVTDLWNYGMPMIRYKMGDVAMKSDHVCSCRRGLPVIGGIEGRVGDFIVDSKGGLVHGEYFTHLFYGVEGVEQFQFIQETRNLIVLRIVPGENFSKSILEPIYKKIKLSLGGQIEVRTEICDTSLIEASGKFRFTISKLSGKYFNK